MIGAAVFALVIFAWPFIIGRCAFGSWGCVWLKDGQK